MAKYSDEQKAAIIAQARANIAMVDEMRGSFRDPNALENIIPLVRTAKPLPEPEPKSYRLTDSEIARMAQDTREQLDEFQRYVSDELSSLLTETFNTIADEFESVRLDLQGIRTRFVETDISALQAEAAGVVDLGDADWVHARDARHGNRLLSENRVTRDPVCAPQPERAALMSTKHPPIDMHSLLGVLIESIVETFAGAMAAASDDDREHALRAELMPKVT